MSDSNPPSVSELPARARLPADVLAELTRLSTARAVWSVAQTLLVSILALAVAGFGWGTWWMVPAVLIVATRQQALFILAHDAAHYRLFPNRRANEVIGRLCAGLVGFSMCAYRLIHRRHHAELYGPGDPDLPLHAGYPRGFGYLVGKLGRDLAGLTAPKTYRYFLRSDLSPPTTSAENGSLASPPRAASQRALEAARVDRRAVIGLQGAMLLIAFASGNGLAYLALWVLPALTVLQALLRLRGICEHGAVRDEAEVYTAARTNHGHRLWMWLLFPHQVHYHLEHHLYPAIPHYRLPECHRLLAERGALQGAEVRPIGDTLGAVFASPRALGQASAGP